MKHFSRRSPTQTVNHTDFEALAARPLLLSIETKKPGVHWDTAQLQMGFWHAAQWSFLAWAVGQKLARQGTKHALLAEADKRAEASETLQGEGRSQPTGLEEGDEADGPTAPVQKVEAKKRSALSALGYLPGIIVLGHRWHLVLSTYDAESGKTTLWTDHLFGTTQEYLEIYATIAGVRKLTAWARDVYLPWFEENVLD